MADICNIIMRDVSKPELYGQTVTVPATYAQQLVDEGKACFERARPIGFVWPDYTAMPEVGPDRDGLSS